MYITYITYYLRLYICFVQGYSKPLSQQVLTVKYLPFGPRKFHTSFQIQVSCLTNFALLCHSSVFHFIDFLTILQHR